VGIRSIIDFIAIICPDHTDKSVFFENGAKIAVFGFVFMGRMAIEELVRMMKLYQPDISFRVPGPSRRS